MIYAVKIYFMGSLWYIWVFMGSSCGSTHEMLKFSWVLPTYANAMNFHDKY